MNTFSHQFDITSGAHEQVLRFQVTVDNAPCMKVIQGFHSTCHIEASCCVIKRTPEISWVNNFMIKIFQFHFF